MNIVKVELNKFNKLEKIALIIIYAILFINAFIMKDSNIALASAFCGITYTLLAGKGLPICYLFGVIGSSFYCYLSFHNALWGNLLLYALYYVPMQILGFFQWSKNLKNGGSEIIKTSLNTKEKIFTIYILNILGDKSPCIDGITTIFSIAGMFLTVKRCIEQWLIWIIVNGLSLVMWLNIALSGEKVFSTVIMWSVYFILAIYFYITWKKELNPTCNPN